jgi:hypothetical protein
MDPGETGRDFTEGTEAFCQACVGGHGGSTFGLRFPFTNSALYPIIL